MSIIPLPNSVSGTAMIGEVCGNTAIAEFDVKNKDGLVCWLEYSDATPTVWVDRIGGRNFIGKGFNESDITSEGVHFHLNKGYQYEEEIIDTNSEHTVIVVSENLNFISSADCDVFFGQTYMTGTMLIDSSTNVRYENGAPANVSTIPSLGLGHRQVSYIRTKEGGVKVIGIKDDEITESTPVSTSIRQSMSPVYIGSELGTKSWCNKKIKRVLIYNRELTKNEVLEI